MNRSWLYRYSSVALITTLVVFLTACDGDPSSGATAAPAGGSTPASSVMGGTVMGGRQPVTGSTITVYTVGSSRSNAATQIGQATSDSSGNFNIATFSPVPTAGQQIYVVAQGGNAGDGNNSAAKLIALLGPYCATGTGCNFPQTVVIDELTTVASVYSVAQYLTDGTTVNIAGASPGLDNAANTIGNLANVLTGKSASLLNSLTCTGSSSDPANCTALEKLNTLADLTASCVNSSGTASSACSGLFTQAGSATDTLGALLNIATQSSVRNNATGVFSQLFAPLVYSPALKAAPNDWSLALTFTGGGLNTPAGVAVDATGNVWVSDSPTPGGAVSKLSPLGVALSPAAGYTGNGISGPLGIAVDGSGAIWVANWAQGSGSTVSKLNANGTAATGSPFSAAKIGGVNPIEGPIDLAITSGGEVWVANYGNSSLTQLSAAGVVTLGPETGDGLGFPTGVVQDNAGDVWVINQSNNSLSEFTSGGVAVGTAAYTGGGLTEPYGIALAANGNIWAADLSGSRASLFVGGNTPPTTCPVPLLATSSGCPISTSSGYTGGGLAGPVGAAVDGAGNVWMTNFHGGSVTELSAAGAALSPSSTGYQGPGMVQPYGLALDGAGNLWVANYGSSSVTEYIGIAAPVATPKIGQPQAL